MNMKLALGGTAAGLSLALLGFVSAAPQTARKFFAANDAQTRASQANMKQVALAMTEYEQDYDLNEPPAAHWTDNLQPYLHTRTALRDPAAPAGVKYSYAFNRNLSRKPLAAIKSPSKTVLLFETTKNAPNASDTGQSVPRPGRHAGGSLYAFVDGSVKWLKDGTKPSFKLTGK